MAGEIEPVGVAPEARGILVDPGDGAAHWSTMWEQVTLGFEHVAEVEQK